jgi:hypothetical protein
MWNLALKKMNVRYVKQVLVRVCTSGIGEDKRRRRKKCVCEHD